MKLAVNSDCCSCSYCYRACPVGAPWYDGEHTQIDQEKCIGCGRCVSRCPLGAIYDQEKPAEAPRPHAPLQLDSDAVVIGAGGSGMPAACRLAEQGRKVLVLEKEKRTGCGALHVAGPLEFYDTKWALDAGAEPVADKKIAQTLAQNPGVFNEALVEKTLHAMPAFFDWLSTFAPVEEKFELTQARGGPPPMEDGGEPGPGGPGAPGGPGGEMPEAMQAGTGMPGSGMGGNSGLVVQAKSYSPSSPMFHNGGEFIMENLFRYAEELGVQILRQTAAEQLLIDDSGRVTGVVAQDPGGEVRISSRVCLVATGSLLLSDALKQAVPDYADAWMPRFAHAIHAYTGDGYRMCQEAGIPVRQEDIWLNITGALVMPCDALTVEYSEASGKAPLIPTDLRPHGTRPEGLMVNLNGERFQNEQMSNITVEYQMQQPQCVAYTILPEHVIRSQPLPARPVYDADGNPYRQMVPMMGEVQWNQEHMDWWASRKGGHLIIADTPAELARQAGMPADTLQATIDRYNALCAQGTDTDFGKDPVYLLPVDRGPYYAVRTFLMSDGAEGGIPIDENCQVQGRSGPVPGLYASGDNSSGNIVKLPGGEKAWITNEYSWALCSGMIAADAMLHALDRTGQMK